MAGDARYKLNPFTDQLIVKTKTKKLSVSSKFGADDDVFINHTTGELLQTNVTTYRKVDDEEFVKIFAQNIAMTFNLTSAGIKAFNILLWCVQYHAIGKDIVQLDDYTLDDFILKNEDRKMSRATLYRGIKELIKAKILARQVKMGFYFINPSFCFNGDRIVFMNAIERKKALSHDTDDQQELPLE
jgi:hypothetical protein